MKLTLIFQTGSLAGQQRQLEQGSLLLGRAPDCSIQFDAQRDTLVSNRHAVIQREGDAFFLLDQNSTNGTFLNGNRVSRTQLNPGDVIMFGNGGPQILVVIEQPRSQTSPSPGQQTTVAATAYTAPSSGQGGYGGPPPPYAPPGPPMGMTPPPGYPPAPPPPPMPQMGMPPPPPPPPMPQMGMNPSQGQFGATPYAVSQSVSQGVPSWHGGIRHTVTNLGMYNPDQGRMAQKERAVSPIGLGCGAIAIIVLAVLVGLILLSNLGPVGIIIGGIVAFIPVPLYLFLWLWLDRYDPEPAWALAGAFAWGALGSVFISIIGNTLFEGIASSIFGPEAGSAMAAIISAPIFEEGSKGLGVLLIALCLRNEFDDVVDGIVYAGVVALGFAAVENILYYGRQFNEMGVVGLVINFFVRGIMAPFSHSMFTAMTGIGCGIARESHNKAVRFLAPFAGLILAMILHALWNTIATFLNFFVFYFVIQVPLFLAFIGVLFFLVRREGKIIRESLMVEVQRGLISQEQLDIATSMVKRARWTMGAFGNWGRFQARRQYLTAIAKLGLCHWHAKRAAQAQGQTQSLPLIPRFQAEILGLREKIV